MLVGSDHHTVEAVFAWRQEREPEPIPYSAISLHRIKDPKVKEAFKKELDNLWEEVRHIEFDNPEDRYT